MPEALRAALARSAALGAAALVLAVLVLPWRPPTLCLLRGLTGIPGPFCGGTTAAVRLGSGDLGGALAASPLVLAGAAVWSAWPVVGDRLRQVVGRTGLRAGLAAAIAAGWAVQLAQR